MTEATDHKRVATLWSVIGKDATEVYNTFTWNRQGDSLKLKEVLKKFEEYSTPKKNLTYERCKFHTRSKTVDETIDEFVTNLKLLAANCNFGNLMETLIADRLVLAVRDAKLKENFLRESELTLDKAANIAKAAERARNECQDIIRNEEEEISKVEHKAHKQKDTLIRCQFCGNKHIRDRQICPANGKTCFKCNKENHFAKVCKAPNTAEINAFNNSDSNDELYVE